MVESFKSRNFNGRLLDAHCREAPREATLFGLEEQRDCAVTSARSDADWGAAPILPGAFSPWRRTQDYGQTHTHTPVLDTGRMTFLFTGISLDIVDCQPLHTNCNHDNPIIIEK